MNLWESALARRLLFSTVMLLFSPPCRCASAIHELPGCRGAGVLGMRGLFYAGLYDERASAPAASGRIRLLNPGYGGVDPVALRFAQIEVD